MTKSHDSSTVPETMNQSHNDHRQRHQDGHYQSRLTLNVYQRKKVGSSTSYYNQQVAAYDDYQQGAGDGAPEKGIFGLRRITFWLVLLACILLLGTIGAGPGAGVIAGHKNDSGSSLSNVSQVRLCVFPNL